MSHRFDVSAVLSSVVLAIILTTSAVAQVDRGAIVGTVADSAGARIGDAQVTITSVAANQSTKVATDAEGNFAANLLRIGTYSVIAEKQGFERTLQSNVEVGVNQTVRVDLSLKVGSAAETVEVSGAAPLLQTEASSLGTIETTRRISELPLNGRNFIQLAYLGPGANGGQTGSNVSGGVFENERANEAISVNGLRVSNNNFLLNGVDNNEFGLGGTIALPPPDAIEEFRTEENSMSAEFGRGGAAVNVVTKSGANQVHGGAYEYIRNDKLDARNFFSGWPYPEKPDLYIWRLRGFAAARSDDLRVNRSYRRPAQRGFQRRAGCGSCGRRRARTASLSERNLRSGNDSHCRGGDCAGRFWI